MRRIKLIGRTLPAYTRGEEIFNMTSHVVGGAFGAIALTLCVVFSTVRQNSYGVVASAIYGAAMIILYTMYSIYHGLSPKLAAKKVFQVIDHCVIFLLIAGTYTLISLCALREQNPVLSIILNAIGLKRYRIFSMLYYLAMGRSILFVAKQPPPQLLVLPRLSTEPQRKFASPLRFY